MYTRPVIVPLDVSDRLYALQDENGVVMGTGTREVCEVLIHIINRLQLTPVSKETSRMESSCGNIRAAIVIR